MNGMRKPPGLVELEVARARIEEMTCDIEKLNNENQAQYDATVALEGKVRRQEQTIEQMRELIKKRDNQILTMNAGFEKAKAGLEEAVNNEIDRLQGEANNYKAELVTSFTSATASLAAQMKNLFEFVEEHRSDFPRRRVYDELVSKINVARATVRSTGQMASLTEMAHIIADKKSV